MRGARTLRSIAASRTLPHHQPASTHAATRRATRRSPSASAAAPASATATAASPTAASRAAFADAMPTQSAATNRCGARRLTVPPARAAVEPRRADSGDRVELVDAGERAVLLAVVEDLLRGHGADPGSASSCSSVAVFRCTGPAGADADGAAPPAEATTRAGTTTCVPSASGAARFTSAMSARRVGPPARATASATRDPPPADTDRAPHRSDDVHDEHRGGSGSRARRARRGRSLVRRARVAEQPVRERQREGEGKRAEDDRSARDGDVGHEPIVAGEASRKGADFVPKGHTQNVTVLFSALALLLGSLHGTVTRGPITPVCEVGTPCEGPAAHIALLFTRAGKTTKTTTGPGGGYRIRLAAGRTPCARTRSRSARSPSRARHAWSRSATAS